MLFICSFQIFFVSLQAKYTYVRTRETIFIHIISFRSQSIAGERNDNSCLNER